MKPTTLRTLKIGATALMLTAAAVPSVSAAAPGFYPDDVRIVSGLSGADRYLPARGCLPPAVAAPVARSPPGTCGRRGIERRPAAPVFLYRTGLAIPDCERPPAHRLRI